MRLAYPAIFYKDEQSGAYAVEVPDLPGCATGGDTLADAILMAVDAASGWVLDELEDGRSAPKPSHMDDIVAESGGFVSMIALDIDAYAEKYGDRAIHLQAK
jgi:predicted RNase H-like HicB family nuclease